MSSRRAIPLKVKLASALLQTLRDDGTGKLVPVISYEESKGMTAAEIISRFHFDHGVFSAHGGPEEPWNITPRPIAEHRAKTAKVDIPRIAKVKRLSKKESEFRSRLLAKDGGEQPPEPKRKKAWPKRKFRSSK